MDTKRRQKMLRKFKVIYIALSNRQREVVIEATSKYDAKQRFYRMHPEYRIVKVEEVYDDEGS